MTTPTLTTPPDPPSRADPANFAARGDAFLGWFPTAFAELTTMINWVVDRVAEMAGYVSSSGTNASTATTQAGIATTQAGNAATSAGTATTQAGIATTQAGLATTAKTNAETAETNAETAQAAAEAARDIALGAAATLVQSNKITSNWTLANGYNALTIGPFEVSPDVTVTGNGNSTWRGI